MKSVVAFPRFGFLLLMSVLLIGFTACQKDLNNNQPNQVAGLMAFNLAPDQPAVAFSISGNLLTNQPLAFSNYSGGYYNIFPGTRRIESIDWSSRNLIDSVSGNFETGKYYSVFLLGKDSSYKNLIVDDKIDALNDSTSNAYIRYINAIPDASSPVVNISANGTPLFNVAAPYSSISEFKEVAPGNVQISISNEGNINSNRTIAVQGKQVYTVLLMGNAASSNPADSVQIKFISNGTLSN